MTATENHAILFSGRQRSPTSTSVRGLGRVPAATQIDSLLGYLAKNDKGVAVEAEDGSIIGIATASGVLEALANSSNVPPAQVKGTK
jgi:CBS domain containing-hemolysin-like protein